MGGVEVVSFNGTVIDVTVNSGGVLVLFEGSTVNGTTVNCGGAEIVFSGATVSGGTLNSGGLEAVNSGGSALITTLNSGGTAKVYSGGLLELLSGSTTDGAITFGTAGGTVRIDGTTMPAGVSSVFAPGDTIDLQGVPYDCQTGATFFENNNTLQVVEDGSTYTLQFDPSQSFSGGFELSDDGLGGTDIKLSPSAVTGYATSVAPNPLAASPYYGVVYIQDKMPDQPSGTYSIGTGFIIGPHSILTAAHVVKDTVGPAAVSSIQIFPGYTSRRSYSSYGATSVVPDPNSVPINNATSELPAIPSNPQYDLAVINVSADLSSYGMFGMQAYYSSATVNLTGYPPNSQYNDLGSVVADFTYKLFDYSRVNGIVSSPGYSGGPLWTYDGTTPTAVGIGVTNSYGVQFTSPDISNILSWEVTGTPCFCRGTRMLTDRGEVTVDNLAIGDHVMTLAGEPKPITWIGCGCVLVTRGRRSADTPILVRKGAWAPNVPCRNLRITKGHSLFLDDVLIPAEFLINHRSILWDDRAGQVEFYHIELATHDVLLADGAPAESYRDDGNRWLFQNANTGWDQPPKSPCAPVLTGGPVVDAAWRRFLDRAGPRPGLPLTDEPDLHLLMDGKRIDGSLRPNGHRAFDLPRRPWELRMVSRAGSPAELGLARDPRMLGVAVRHVQVWQGARLRMVDAADESLAEGFHAFEPDNGFRWTDGDALLPATLFAGIEGACQLDLLVSATTRYPLLAEAIRRAAA
jgi:autotransporter passenger strand-loop-strand repeat protein